MLVLVEVLLVIIIIGLLAAMWLPAYIGGNEPADVPARTRR
jgi:hypothetical protein